MSTTYHNPFDPRSGKHENSLAAYFDNDRSLIHRQVICAVHQAGSNGMTADEIQEVTGLDHQQVSPAVTILKRANVFVEAPELGKRKTRLSGLATPVIIHDGRTKAVSPARRRYLERAVAIRKIAASPPARTMEESWAMAFEALDGKRYGRAKIQEKVNELGLIQREIKAADTAE